MTVLSTTAQAAGLTALVTLAFVAAGFVFFTDVGRPVSPAPVTNPAEVGSTGGGPAAAQAAPSADAQTPTPLPLTGADATSPRLNVAGVSAAGGPAARGESVHKVEGANSPVPAAQGQELTSRGNFVQPEAPASSGAGETSPPAAAAANVTPGAGSAAERLRPGTASELARPLAQMGHRVHAALSGDDQSATLSVTGATVTKEDAVRWLGSAGARRELRAAGVRIVVVVSGPESWTFML